MRRSRKPTTGTSIPVIVLQIRLAPYCGATFRPGQGRVKVRRAFELATFMVITSVHISQWPNAVLPVLVLYEEAQRS
jgi:hypothetical protein